MFSKSSIDAVDKFAKFNSTIDDIDVVVIPIKALLILLLLPGIYNNIKEINY
jgi:hypothetical protein